MLLLQSFIFSVSHVNYKKYDWSRISTLSIAGDALRNYSADIMCTAHSNGVRVVPLGEKIVLNKITLLFVNSNSQYNVSVFACNPNICGSLPIMYVVYRISDVSSHFY